MGTEEEQRLCIDTVIKCMQEDQRARNDDMWLCLKVWEAQGIKVQVDFSDIGKMMRPETISRSRRYVQNTLHSLIPTSPEVLERRGFREQEIRAYYRDTPKEHVITNWQEYKYGVK